MLYPSRSYYSTHYLNSFRGEPAISQFDWPFTPNPQVIRALFQQAPVRSSSKCYLTFNLLMARSLGFGFLSVQLIALFRLAFATPTPIRLKLAAQIKSLTHYTKGTPSLIYELRLLVGIRFQVLFHSPHRGSFHLSLTVLVHYRSLKSI